VASPEPLIVEFREDHRDAVVDRMVLMASAGAGWINFTPGLDLDVPPAPRSPLASLLTARGPTVPLGTWMPRQGRDPSTVGIEHPEGPRAIAQLAERGVALPQGWRVLQDHPKRGVVLAVTAGDEPAELDSTLDWLLTATGVLCPWPRTGEWRALCHLP
jgi:hypothetical protein